ncbi:hypothetical protein BJ742DRAFT_873369 [Cladochytrium replicatum]|nr:hypothetical protein BJ742DRAFT_873369 [Cladochytrium replicatum]
MEHQCTTGARANKHQYKIVEAATEIQRVAIRGGRPGLRRTLSEGVFVVTPQTSLTWKKFSLYLKGVLRSAFFSFNVVMTYLAVGGHFGPIKMQAWSTNGLSVCVLILMTDAHRFQNALDILRGETPNGGQSNITSKSRTSLRTLRHGTSKLDVKVIKDANTVNKSNWLMEEETPQEEKEEKLFADPPITGILLKPRLLDIPKRQ